MKLSAKIEKALNEQINLELSSAYAYLGMAAYFGNSPFAGFAKWMEIQYQEELGHAQRIYKYVIGRNGVVTLKAIAEPKTEFRSALEVFRTSLAHEQKVSASICGIYELASAEKDYPTVSFLKWFLDEQVEEEKNVTEIVTKLEMIGDNRNGLFQLDHHAGKRGEKD